MKSHIIPLSSFPMRVDERIHMLGNYFFNLFLVTGDKKSALFEVGITAIVDSVISQLEKLEIEPDYLISSHPHSDHITGLPGLVERYPNASVIAARGAAEFIEHPKAAPLLFKEDAFMAGRLADHRIIPGRPPLEKIPDLGNADLVDERRALDLGGIQLELLRVDGHSPANLIGLIPDKKILLCSDSIGFHFPGRGYQPLFFTDSEAYVNALKFIRDFHPEIICPAHQGPMKGKNARNGIQEALETTLNIIETIRTSSLSDRALEDLLFRQSYKDEFTLYTESNIRNCSHLLVKRAKESPVR